MNKTLFYPSAIRDWTSLVSGTYIVKLTGWAFVDGCFYNQINLAKYVLSATSSEKDFLEVLSGLNGNFAIVVEGNDQLHIAVDPIRSIPMFYRHGTAGIKISDDLTLIKSDSDSVDITSAVEFEAAGFVSGPYSLFQGIYGLQAGEYMSLNMLTGSTVKNRYYKYECTYHSNFTTEELCEQLNESLTSAFERVIESIGDRQVVLPLSGGLDSRLVAATLKGLNYENVLCFSYGVHGNWESDVGKHVAETLGYQWVPIEYTPITWRTTLESTDYTRYRKFATNAVSFPLHDGFPAIQLLREQGTIDEDAVFMPGHTGDFISGGHLKYVFDPTLWDQSPTDFKGAIIKKHYSMWAEFIRNGYIRNLIELRLDNVMSEFTSSSYQDIARNYEFWEWQERQAKFIINSVRSYEFFGYSWRIPLWDKGLMEFWKAIPITLKMRQYLYKVYLQSYDQLGLFSEDHPTPMWTWDDSNTQNTIRLRKRVYGTLKKMPVLSDLFTRYDQYKRHVKEWNKDPRQEAHIYSKLHYLVKDADKKHVQSLSLRDFLKTEFGIEIRYLKNAARDINY